MPSCPASTGCNSASRSNPLPWQLHLAAWWCWEEGREKDMQGCPWDMQGRQDAGRPAWRLGFTSQMENYRLGSAALWGLGSSTALGNCSRKGLGCAGLGGNVPPGGSEFQGSGLSLWKEEGKQWHPSDSSARIPLRSLAPTAATCIQGPCLALAGSECA